MLCLQGMQLVFKYQSFSLLCYVGTYFKQDIGVILLRLQRVDPSGFRCQRPPFLTNWPHVVESMLISTFVVSSLGLLPGIQPKANYGFHVVLRVIFECPCYSNTLLLCRLYLNLNRKWLYHAPISSRDYKTGSSKKKKKKADGWPLLR